MVNGVLPPKKKARCQTSIQKFFSKLFLVGLNKDSCKRFYYMHNIRNIDRIDIVASLHT